MKIIYAVILLAVLAFVSMAHAQDGLLVVAEKNFAPYSFQYDTELRGIDYEIFREAAARLEVAVRVKLVDRAEMLEMLEQGTCDGALAVSLTEDTKKTAIFSRSVPLHLESTSVFVKAVDRFAIKSVADLDGLRVGAVEQYQPDGELADMIESGAVELLREKTVSDCVKLLFQGRIDAFLGNTEPTFFLLKKMGMLSTIAQVRKPVSKGQGAYLAFSKKAMGQGGEDLAKLFELALEGMLVDGSYREIERRYVLQ